MDPQIFHFFQLSFLWRSGFADQPCSGSVILPPFYWSFRSKIAKPQFFKEKSLFIEKETKRIFNLFSVLGMPGIRYQTTNQRDQVQKYLYAFFLRRILHPPPPPLPNQPSECIIYQPFAMHCPLIYLISAPSPSPPGCMSPIYSEQFPGDLVVSPAACLPRPQSRAVQNYAVEE